jgi:NAD(P)-dependent dehydrogenase (short-subunit alcohol dehydrogenase family)
VVAEQIVAAHPSAELLVRRLDLADLGSVHAFAADLAREARPVDGLVNNAGVLAPPVGRTQTADGFELQWGTNFLGPFALTNLLVPLLLQSPAPRVATMTSSAASIGRINFADLDATGRYLGLSSYAQSKLGNLLMALQLARVATRRGWPLLSTAAHPGYTATDLTRAWPVPRASGDPRPGSAEMSWTGQPVEVGAQPLLYAATDPGVEQGGYYGPGRARGLFGPTVPVALPRAARAPSLARSVWAVAEDLTGTRLAS